MADKTHEYTDLQLGEHITLHFEDEHVKSSAVHFVRFDSSPAARQAVRAGAAVKRGCDHANYPAGISPETLASLAGDLK